MDWRMLIFPLFGETGTWTKETGMITRGDKLESFLRCWWWWLLELPSILSWFYPSFSLVNIIRESFLSYIYLSAKKVWKRHELLKSKIGVFPDEELSFENVNSIFYAVVGLIPTLTFLEIILYCLYQCKVSKTETLNFELFTIYYKFHPWREILANEEVECNENQENVKIKTVLYCFFQHKVS